MKNPEKIISEYLRYIKTIANRYNQPQYFDDMVQIGKIAAIDAYSRLDTTKINNDEKSYITTCIKGSIMNFLSNNARTIRIPKYIQKEVNIPTLSINLPINDDGGTIEDLLPSSDSYIPIESNEGLRIALLSLKPKQKLILEMYYDLQDNNEPMTFQQIGDELGISKQAVKQHLDNAITKLRKKMFYGN
jgi:RNA polymerase sigma factor (sigma-70 family)